MNVVNLNRKNEAVNLRLHPEFIKAAPIIRACFIMGGAQALVTSGMDGVHSEHSAHHKGQAIDLRSFRDDVARQARS